MKKILVALVVFLVSCSNVPGESEISKALIDQADNCSGCFKLSNIKKLNGMQSANGNGYIVLFNGDLYLKEEAALYLGYEGKAGNIKSLKHITRGKVESEDSKHMQLSRGDHFFFGGAIEFWKTEKGWLPKEIAFERFVKI